MSEIVIIISFKCLFFAGKNGNRDGRSNTACVKTSPGTTDDLSGIAEHMQKKL
jgi:hypothetical protein